MFTFGVIWALLVVSLNVLVGYAGQVSLGHAAFFGIGAYTVAILSTRYGVPYPATLISAMGVTGVCGLLLGLPSLRVRHDFLVLVTIGLNFLVVALFNNVDFFGGAMGIVGIPMASVGGYELRGWAFLLFCTVLTGLSAYVCYLLQKTWAGMGLFTVRDDERAASSVGVNVARYKIAAFGISGIFAGLAGGLYAPFIGNVFPDQFGFISSVTLLAMLVFGGMGTVRGALFGGAVFKMLPEYLRFADEYRFAIYGGALLLMICLQPQGILGKNSLVMRGLNYAWTRLTGSNRGSGPSSSQPSSEPESDLEEPADESDEDADPHRLTVRDVRVEFGGLKALDGVDMEVETGEIVGLIGPNGAGKTTLINAITGQVSLAGGEIHLDEQPLHGRSPDRIARDGIARTFQVTRPFEGLDVTDNIISGLGVNVYHRFEAFFSRFGPAEPRAREFGREAGVQEFMDADPAEIPIGLLRRMEVARAMGIEGTFVLLDEPAAGLTYGEVEELRELVQTIPSPERGVVLIEHNMRFAMNVCDRIVVLASGKVLARGTPDEVRRDPEVIDVYLGKEA